MNINSFAAHKPKDELVPFLYEPKSLAAHEVLVKITHCGICHSDLHLIDNDWMVSKYPLVPGHEIIGLVSEVGADVRHLKPGDRVGIGWQSGSCHNCDYCNTGQENLCKQGQPTCNGHYGGFAEFVVTDSKFAFQIPEGLDSVNAAPLLCAGITVYSPMRIYGVQPHHKVGVIGIGGLGHVALQFAKAFGCEVTAFSSSPDKKEEAVSFGASHFVNSKDTKTMQDIYGTLDYILTTVTAPLDWASYIKILRPNGRLNFVGGTVGNLDIPVSLILGHQKSVSGSAIGGRPMMNDMLRFAERHNIKAKTEVMPLGDVNSAILKVRKNEARYRMVLEM